MSVPPSWNLSCNALIGFSRYPSTSSTSDVRFKRVSNQGGYVPTFSDTFEKSLRKKTLHSLIHGIIVAAPSSPSIFMDFWSWWFPSCAQILAIFEHWKAMCFFLQRLSCRPFQAVCNQMTIPWEDVFGTLKWQATTTSLKSRGWLDMVPILMAKQGTCTEGMWWPQRRDGKHLKSCESQVLNLLNRMENDGKWLNLWLITICHEDRSSGA